MWHVYVSLACVCMHKPLLSPRHPPGVLGEVGRLKIAPGSLNTGSQNITAHESHRLSVSPSPSFPFPHALFSSQGNENLSLDLQTDGLCKYGDVTQVRRNAPELQDLPMNQWCPLILTNNNHLWLISFQTHNWLNASALIQSHGRGHGSITSRSGVYNCIFFLINEPVIRLFFSCATSLKSPPPHTLTLLKTGFLNYVGLQSDAPSRMGSVFLLLLEALKPSVCFTPHWPTSTKNEDNSLAQRHGCLM